MMEDSGADLSTEDASSMALAAAEAAAAAEEQELAAAVGGVVGHEDGDTHNDVNDDVNDDNNDIDINNATNNNDDDGDANGVGSPHLDHQSHQDFAPNDIDAVENNGADNPAIAAATTTTTATEDNNNNSSNDDDDNANNSNSNERSKCRICGKGPDDDGRVLCRFLPAQVDANTSAIAPGVMTFEQDIALHVFCGKTASILPNVNQPDLEILSKAGIKNKHGIGPEVNGALARTRSSTVSAEGAKEKTFYIVKEFEAHLAAIRSASMGVAAAAAIDHRMQQQQQQHHHQHAAVQQHAGYHHGGGGVHPGTPLVDSTLGPPVDPAFDPLYHTATAMVSAPIGALPNNSSMKILPHKAGHSYQKQQQQHHHIHHPGNNRISGGSANHAADPWIDVTITPDGKIRCGCGGTHLPTGTAKGDASWRSHVMTKRHQKWMEENGLLGAV